MNDKVREMIKDALISDGVEDLFKIGEDETQINVDIFSDEYLEKIKKIELPNTKIKILQQLLKQSIDQFMRVNKIKGIDFSEKFKELVAKYNNRKDDLAMTSELLEELAEEFANLFEELQKEKTSFEKMGIDFEEKAFYDILTSIAIKHEFEYPHKQLIELSKAVKNIVDDKSKYTDWSQREDIKAELKVALILVLADHGYPPVPKDEVYKEIFEQAENFKHYHNII
jgi:type I restriction enzyme R subunit